LDNTSDMGFALRLFAPATTGTLGRKMQRNRHCIRGCNFALKFYSLDQFVTRIAKILEHAA